MKTSIGASRSVVLAFGCVGLLLSGLTEANSATVPPTILRTPDGGIQPQAVMDAQGTLHLVYFKGKPGEGDIYYVKREPGQERFSAPMQVNSQRGSAIATGTIRGAQIALGKNNRVHVAWNGSMQAAPRSFNKTGPMLYARLDDAGKAFEAQRNLMQQTFNLDGGGALGADDMGNVYVAWHALKVGNPNGEENRQVWVTHSKDEGKTFPKEALAFNQPVGACGCCGMKAFVDSAGTVHLLFRSATAKVNRDMYLLSSKDKGKSFQSALLQKWKINSCTMSSESFAEGPAGVLAAWETENQVYFARFAPGSGKVGQPIAAPGPAGERKHPAVAMNAQGETLLVWTEGTGWERGGALAWCVFDKNGKATDATSRIERGIPVWGLPTAVVGSKGEFIIIH